MTISIWGGGGRSAQDRCCLISSTTSTSCAISAVRWRRCRPFNRTPCATILSMKTTVVIVKFASGALGTVNITDTAVAPWSWEHTTGENPDYPHTDQICYQIGGTHGSLSVPRLELWTNEAKRGWLEPFRIERHVAAEDG